MQTNASLLSIPPPPPTALRRRKPSLRPRQVLDREGPWPPGSYHAPRGHLYAGRVSRFSSSELRAG